MQKPLVDHWWTKIAEREEVGLTAAKDKLRELAEIERAISDAEGTDVMRNVLADGQIRRALERCIQIHEGDTLLDESDRSIYYNYATTAAKDSERIIDEELAYLEL